MNKSIKLIIGTVILLFLTIPLSLYWIKAKGTVLNKEAKSETLRGRKIRVLCMKNLKPVDGQGNDLTIKQGKQEQDDELTYWNYSFRGDTLFVSQKSASKIQISPGVTQTTQTIYYQRSLTFDTLPEVIIAENAEQISVDGAGLPGKTLTIKAKDVDRTVLKNIYLEVLNLNAQVRSGFFMERGGKISQANFNIGGTCSLDLGSAKINKITAKLGPDVQLLGDREIIEKLLAAN